MYEREGMCTACTVRSDLTSPRVPACPRISIYVMCLHVITFYVIPKSTVSIAALSLPFHDSCRVGTCHVGIPRLTVAKQEQERSGGIRTSVVSGLMVVLTGVASGRSGL